MIRNQGNNVLTNVPVGYKLGANPVVNEVAPLTIAIGDSALYQFTTGLNLTASTTYKLALFARMGSDANYTNDTIFVSFTTGAVPQATLSQNFQSSVFPPSSWTLTNFGGPTWTRSSSIIGATGATTNSARMDNFTTNLNGARDYLNSPLVDVTGFGQFELTFDRAYAPRLSRKDSLLIWISTDCGETFVPTGYAKDFAGLATAAARTTLFTPASSSEWIKDTLNLSAFAGNKILIRFVVVSRFGNVLYIDNVRTNGIPVAIQELRSSTTLKVYPDPAESAIRIEIPESVSTNAQILVFGMDGRAVLKSSRSLLSQNREMNISLLPTGIYNLILQDGAQIFQARFVKK